MMVEEYRLDNRVAIVTGAGRGIGFSIAQALGKAGATVVVADIRRDLAEGAGRRLAESCVPAMALVADVSSGLSVRAMVEQVMAEFGRIDILVNNAGIHPFTAFAEVTELEWDRVLSVNLKSIFLTSQAVHPIMKKQGKGKILNVASMAGRTGGRASAVHYAASKAGVMGITRWLAMHLGPDGILCNAVAPGVIQTDMTASWSEETMANFLKQLPVGRLGTGEDIAKVALFLCSDAADYLTGVVLDVTGGLVMS
jgi:3-oxoacyl-[acyl-carrier protein] reductase